MSVTAHRVRAGWYTLTDETAADLGLAISHPRCLPRSWWLKLKDGRQVDRDPQTLEGWRTMKSAIAWLDGHR